MSTENSDLLRCGVAVRDITPERSELLEPTGMKRLVPTRGVLDPLRAECLALRCGGKLAFVVTSDLRTLSSLWVAEVQGRVAAATGCEATSVLLGSVHNHCSSPVAWGGDEAPPEGREAEAAANRKIVEAMVDGCVSAAADMRPAELAGVTVELTERIGENRRALLSNGTCVNAWGSGPIVPPGLKLVGAAGEDARRVQVLCVRELGAALPMVVLTGYDCHPHLGAAPYFSGESVGEYKRQIEAALPGVVSMHASATGGDCDLHCVHPIPDGGEPAETAWFRAAAVELGGRFSRGVVPAVWSLAGWHRPAKMRAAYHREGELDGGVHRLLILAALALGERVAIVSMPGEFFNVFGRQIYGGSPFEFTLLSGYNGSMLGYTPTPLNFEQGSYEVMRGPVATAAEETVHTPRGATVRASLQSGPTITGQVLEMLRVVKG